jgi:LuxR family maltose regulon positive regulatory protein
MDLHQVRLELARAHLGLRRQPRQAVLGRPTRSCAAGPAWVTLLAEDHDQAASQSDPGGQWAMSLTAAELQMLPLLATYLTFNDIAARLGISRNTVKSHVNSIYRKFGVSSRGTAVDHAIALGLLEASHFLPA